MCQPTRENVSKVAMFLLLVCLIIIPLSVSYNPLDETIQAWDLQAVQLNQAIILEMFQHALDGYMSHGFPADYISPLNCQPHSSLGHDLATSLIQNIDSILVVGNNITLFEDAVLWIITRFDISKFHPRMEAHLISKLYIGPLLSAHMLIHSGQYNLERIGPHYSGELLLLAKQLGDLLLDQFSTSTNIPAPFLDSQNGTILFKVSDIQLDPRSLSIDKIASYITEFKLLSILTQDTIYRNTIQEALKEIVRNTHSQTGLFGNRIDVVDGKFYKTDARTSFSGPILFQISSSLLIEHESKLEKIFKKLIKPIEKHCFAGPWPIFVRMDDVSFVTPQVEMNAEYFAPVFTYHKNMTFGAEITAAFHSLWEQFGSMPTVFDIHQHQLASNAFLSANTHAFSLFYLSKSTNHPSFHNFANTVLHDLRDLTRGLCGWTQLSDIETLAKANQEDPQLFSTLKWLYLLFDIEFNLEDFSFTSFGNLIPLSSIESSIQTSFPIQLVENTCLPDSSLRHVWKGQGLLYKLGIKERTC